MVTAPQLPDSAGFGPRTRSRVVLSAAAYPTYGLAADTAAAFAAAARRGIPLEVLPRH